MPVPVIPPGLIVHGPVKGKLSRITLPVGLLQVGCIMVDTKGAVGNVTPTAALPIIVAVQPPTVFVATTV